MQVFYDFICKKNIKKTVYIDHALAYLLSLL